MFPGYKKETIKNDAGKKKKKKRRKKSCLMAGIQTQRKVKKGRAQRGQKWEKNFGILTKSGREMWRRNKARVNRWWDQIWGGGTEDAEGSGVGAQKRKRETEPLHQPGPRREGGRGEPGSLTLVLVRLALALARRVGLTASAIDPTASPSPFVLVKTLRFRQSAQFQPPDCHMIDFLALPEKGRKLGTSTGCSVGQTTPRSLFTGG